MTLVAPDAPPQRRPGMPVVNPRLVLATAMRLLRQLRADARAVGLLLALPCLLLTMLQQVFTDEAYFDRIATIMLGVFPVTLLFLVTCISTLRERTSGTLERLLTTPLSRLDFLSGYALGFAVAAVVQVVVEWAFAFAVLGIEVAGSPVAVLVVAFLGALLGLGAGLLVSPLVASEFEAVQLMPFVIFPQLFVGGLFVPREQMADWLESLSNVFPMTYVIEALTEVNERSVVTPELVRDAVVIAAVALACLVAAPAVLRRRTGDASPAQRRRRILAAVTVLVVVAAVVVHQGVDAARWVTADDARVVGDAMPVVATTSGTLVDWSATSGSTFRARGPIGRLQVRARGAEVSMVLRAPGAGTVVEDAAVPGAYVVAGTRLATLYDLDALTVEARVDEDDVRDLAVGRPAELVLGSAPGRTVPAYVTRIDSAGGRATGATRTAGGSGVEIDDRVGVTLSIPRRAGVPVLPGTSVTARIARG